MQLASLADVFGDLVIYRDLNAVDARLPRYADIWHEIGMDGPIPPRKLDMAYARALARLLTRSHELEHGGSPLIEVVYLGDNLLSDGGTFRNLRTLTGWPGWCFIGAERDERPAMTENDCLFQANRWSTLADFLRQVRAEGAALDESTAVIVDIDKTAIGARGRNDKAIDRARVAAIEATLGDAIGAGFDGSGFRQAYAALNSSRYYPLTADNQDNVAYICLMIGAGIIELDQFQAQAADGRLKSLAEFMAQVDARSAELPVAVRSLHEEIYRRTLAGDLTPFKEFRRREYQETVSRMGRLPEETVDSAPTLAQRLVEEICITGEVLAACEWLKGRGCLMVALSDKPDEATGPTPELAAQGWPPLHRARTHVVGQSLGLG